MRPSGLFAVLILGLVGSTTLLTACGTTGSGSASRAAAEALSQSSAPASATMAETADASDSPDVGSGSSAATSDTGGVEHWNDFSASDTETATLTLHLTKRPLYGQLPANGRELAVSDATQLVYSLIYCSFGCSANFQRFNLPAVDGPLAFTTATTELSGALSWQITIVSENWIGGGFRSAYPNQVVFTGAQKDGSGDGTFTELGFSSVDLGEQVGPGIKSWLAPARWPVPSGPMIGELRLFRAGTALPSGWIVADGRAPAAKQEGLSFLLKSAGFVQGGAARTPMMPKVSGYIWAIAAEGNFPMFED